MLPQVLSLSHDLVVEARICCEFEGCLPLVVEATPDFANGSPAQSDKQTLDHAGPRAFAHIADCWEIVVLSVQAAAALVVSSVGLLT